MDTVILDGVTYVKASVAAKSFRYTSDYIGQLCRAKKVDARLVGRTWFVNIDSIREHKQNKFKVSSDDTPKESSIAKETKISRIAVHPVVGNKTIKVIKGFSLPDKSSRTLSVSYDKDEEALIPRLTRKHIRPPKTIRVELASSKKVKISGSKITSVTFEAGELPEVALSGSLNVTAYPDQKTVVDVTKKTDIKPDNKAISPKQDNFIKPDTAKNNISSHNQKSVVVYGSTTKATINKKTDSIKKPDLAKSLQDVTPIQSPFTPSLIQATEVQKTPTLTLVSPLIATTLAVICVLLILSASITVVTFGSVHESQIVFQMANLLDVLKH